MIFQGHFNYYYLAALVLFAAAAAAVIVLFGRDKHSKALPIVKIALLGSFGLFFLMQFFCKSFLMQFGEISSKNADSGESNFLFVLLRYLQLTMVFLLPFAVIYKKVWAQRILLCFTAPVTLVNFAFNNVYASSELYYVIIYQLCTLCALLLSVATALDFRTIFAARWEPKQFFKTLGSYTLMMLGMLLLLLPVNFFHNFPAILPARVKAFSLGHIVMFALLLIVVTGHIVLFPKLVKKFGWSQETQFHYVRILSVGLLITFLYRYPERIFSGQMNLNELPLQICNIGVFTILAGVLTKNKWLLGFSFFFMQVGGFINFVYPSINYALFGVYSMIYFLSHILLLLIPVMMFLTGMYQPSKKDFLTALIAFGMYYILVFSLNVLFRHIAIKYEYPYTFTGFFYTLGFGIPLFDSLIDLLSFHIGYAKIGVVYNLLLVLGFILLSLAVYGIYALAVRLKNKQSLSSLTKSEEPA